MSLSPRPSDAELLSRAKAQRDAIGLPFALVSAAIVPGPNAIVSAIAGDKRSRRGEKRDDPEAREQRALFAKIDGPDGDCLPELRQCYAVPNGGKRGMLTAKKMKAEGVRRGELDINLDLARGGFFGLRLEMKAEDGALSVLQLSRVEQHRKNGYAAEAASGVDEAWRILVAYVAMQPTKVAR